jgi:hypothetical protein
VNAEYDDYVRANAEWIAATVQGLTAALSHSSDSTEYAQGLPKKVETALTVCLQNALDRQPDDEWSYGVADDIAIAMFRRSNGPKLMDVYVAQLRPVGALPVPPSWPSFGPTVSLEGDVISVSFDRLLFDFGSAE